MYELMLHRLYNDSMKNGAKHAEHLLQMRKRILVWVSLADERISLAEMQDICITEDGVGFHPDKVLPPTENQILQACGSLVEITLDGDCRMVVLSHKTVREFLMKPLDELSPDAQKEPAITSCMIGSLTEAHASITLTCRKSRDRCTCTPRRD